MASFASTSGTLGPLEVLIFGQQSGVSSDAYLNPAEPEIVPVAFPVAPNSVGELQTAAPARVVQAFGSYASTTKDGTGIPAWFDRVHVLPRTIAYPNLLSTQLVDVDVHSAFRTATHSWTGYTSNAGAGVDLATLPGFPSDLDPMQTVDLVLTISTVGPGVVDDTLDFAFASGTISIPISITRIILFDVRPENDDELVEVLEWVTQIHAAISGKEKRPSMRESPRQFLEYDFRLYEDGERQTIQNVLFAWQGNTFGVPFWKHETEVAAAVTAGDTTITVGSTDYRDFRVGGNAIIIDEATGAFDVLVVDSLTSSTITFTSATSNSHAVGVTVAPLRLCVIEGRVSGARYPNAVLDLGTVRFRVTDNEADLADTSGFSSFNSKVLFDDDNGMEGATSPEAFDIEVTDLDSIAGLVYVASDWPTHKPVRPKTFFAKGRAASWALRQVLYALRGRQVSFYLPTKKSDLTLTDDISSGVATMNVRNDGYTRFVGAAQPRNVIRISFNDGTPAVLRTVLSSVEIDATEETLTVDSNWTASYSQSIVDRIEFVEKMRFDQDRIELRTQRGGVDEYCTVGCRGVFE